MAVQKRASESRGLCRFASSGSGRVSRKKWSNFPLCGKGSPRDVRTLGDSRLPSTVSGKGRSRKGVHTGTKSGGKPERGRQMPVTGARGDRAMGRDAELSIFQPLYFENCPSGGVLGYSPPQPS